MRQGETRGGLSDEHGRSGGAHAEDGAVARGRPRRAELREQGRDGLIDPEAGGRVVVEPGLDLGLGDEGDLDHLGQGEEAPEHVGERRRRGGRHRSLLGGSRGRLRRRLCNGDLRRRGRCGLAGIPRRRGKGARQQQPDKDAGDLRHPSRTSPHRDPNDLATFLWSR